MGGLGSIGSDDAFDAGEMAATACSVVATACSIANEKYRANGLGNLGAEAVHIDEDVDVGEAFCSEVPSDIPRAFAFSSFSPLHSAFRRRTTPSTGG